MPDSVPLSHLDAEEKARRAATFGTIAEDYERFRPGPDPETLDWVLASPCDTVVDLGAGTGGLTRLLVERVPRVIAVEPDDQMRSVLEKTVPAAEALKGTGESMPLPDASADAICASASWHWMEPVAALFEVHRVLRPGGVLGVLWSGPNPEGPFMMQARALMSSQGGDDVASNVMGDAERPASILEIPEGARFTEPEQRTFFRDIPLTADDIVGLLSTFSWMILLDEASRAKVFETARRLLREALGVEGEATVDVQFRTQAWRAFPLDS